jgi:hypothetical protein
MLLQIRIYTINRGKLAVFAESWLQGVYPLRLQHGFVIPGAWAIEQTNQFVWLMGYDGPGTWEAKEKAYYNSPERKAFDPDPAQYIARAEQYFVQPVVP